MIRALAAAAILAGIAAVAVAGEPLVIGDNPGGNIETFDMQLREIAASGRPVVIDGDCRSACTMILALPPDQICATPRAKLGFHTAWSAQRIGSWLIYAKAPDGTPLPDPEATAFVVSHYPPAVRAWIDRQGGLTPKMKFLAGADLRAIVRACD